MGPEAAQDGVSRLQPLPALGTRSLSDGQAAHPTPAPPRPAGALGRAGLVVLVRSTDQDQPERWTG